MDFWYCKTRNDNTPFIISESTICKSIILPLLWVRGFNSVQLKFGCFLCALDKIIVYILLASMHTNDFTPLQNNKLIQVQCLGSTILGKIKHHSPLKHWNMKLCYSSSYNTTQHWIVGTGRGRDTGLRKTLIFLTPPPQKKCIT